jgi:hypothetical protein
MTDNEITYDRIAQHYEDLRRIGDKLSILRSKESADPVLHSGLHEIFKHHGPLFYPFVDKGTLDTSKLPASAEQPTSMSEFLEGFDRFAMAVETLYGEREPIWKLSEHASPPVLRPN